VGRGLFGKEEKIKTMKPTDFLPKRVTDVLNQDVIDELVMCMWDFRNTEIIVDEADPVLIERACRAIEIALGIDLKTIRAGGKGQ